MFHSYRRAREFCLRMDVFWSEVGTKSKPGNYSGIRQIVMKTEKLFIRNATRFNIFSHNYLYGNFNL